MSTLSENLKAARKRMGFTQAQVATMLQTNYNLKVNRVMITKWETGTQTPVVSNLKYLAMLYNTTMDALNGFSDSSPVGMDSYENTSSNSDQTEETANPEQMRKRIKYLRKSLNLSQEAFGHKLGVSRSVINNLERGNTMLKEPLQSLFCSTYNVNKHWLTTGKGEMFLPKNDSPSDDLQKQYALSDNVVNILQNFFQLSPEDQKSFIKQAEKILHKDN